jgi:CRISPR-associated protein Cas1
MGVVYVLQHDVRRALEGGRLLVRRGREVVLEKPLIHVEGIVIFSNAQISTQLLKECAQAGIGVHFLSQNGAYLAHLSGPLTANAPVRVAQFAVHLDPVGRLRLGRAFVAGKLKNQATVLRRREAPEAAAISDLLETVERADNLEELRAIEGQAAKLYFASFSRALPEEFAFGERSRRPPRDPANSLLSLAYTFLTKEMISALQIAGLDAQIGYLHATRHGRPALALDLIEEFRPLVADSVVLGLLNNGRITLEHFQDPAAPQLVPEGWPKFLTAWEERINEKARHPALGISMSYREIFLAQARILGKVLLGELPEYLPFTVR